MVRNRCFFEPRAPDTDALGHLHMTQHFLRNRYQTAVYPPPTACCGALSLACPSHRNEQYRRGERDDDDDDNHSRL